MEVRETHRYNDEDPVEVIDKQECISPGLIRRFQKKAIESFSWDPSYASDIIEISSKNRSLFLKEE